MCKIYPTYKKNNNGNKKKEQTKTGKWRRKRQYVSSGNTNAGLFFSEGYIFLDAIFRRCESILNILRRNNKGTKTQPMFSETEIPLNEFGT